MAQVSTPAAARPWAPVALREWPETLSEPSGETSSTPSKVAACMIVAVMASFEHAVPDAAGNNGRSGGAAADCHRSGKWSLRKLKWSHAVCAGHDADGAPWQEQPCSLAVPTAVMSDLEAGR